MTYPLRLGVDVDVRQLAAFGDNLEAILSDTSLERFLHRNTADYLKARLDDRFAAGGDDVVGIWAQLQPSTQAIRAAAGYGASSPINIRTGQMQAYLEGAAGIISGSGDMDWTFPGTGMSSDIEDKLLTAQGGSMNPPTVARPVLGMNRIDLEYLTDEFGMFIMGGL